MEVAKEMAKGLATLHKTDVAIAVTGIAGPDGGSEEKPVGLVYIGCYLSGRTVVAENIFKGSRTEVREQATKAALMLLLECMEEMFGTKEGAEKGKYE